MMLFLFCALLSYNFFSNNSMSFKNDLYGNVESGSDQQERTTGIVPLAPKTIATDTLEDVAKHLTRGYAEILFIIVLHYTNS